ncbi:glycosyltransferase family 39 protein [Gramella sp. KN1008]|uniref:ArnT family glycosyltransferase n=1 Tax=Gramella sp. KN1008 TaxID=2529298 RepID=UPI00103D1B57|nr:glycosyltransferase family 39 protein [Gramella sp. KN1008]TBW30427.1 glycosyltransferase family 39 protein [Gramella sp. KN1008]
MSKKRLILFGFILVKFLLQYILISPEYDLQRDEYLHLDLGNHLDWGYLSVPPFIAWVSKIIYLLGNSVFWVKFFPALFGALTIVVVWKSIEQLKGNLFALILGATCVLLSVLLRLNTLYQPNSFDVLSWTLFYYILIRYINSENSKWIYMAALVFALGFLNKYNIVFLVIGLIPAILLTEQRSIFRLKQLYIAAILGLLLIAPNLLWQYQNDFPVIHHMNELANRQLVHVNKLDFLKSQVFFFIGSLFVIISALYALVFYKPFKKFRLFFWAFFFTLAVFMILRAKDYYAIGLYPIYISFGSVFLGQLLKDGRKSLLQPVAIAVPVLLFIPIFNIAFPNKSPEYIIANSEKYRELGLLRWEDGKDHLIPQDYADMLGWKELAQKVDSVYSLIPGSEQTLVLCDNYGQAGAINYYSKKGIKAVSFNADYINWFELDQPYKNLIRIKSYDEKDKELKDTSQYFESGIIADSITNRYAREYGATILVFTTAKIDVNERLENEIEEVRSIATSD